MNKRMLISVDRDESRAAVVEGGQLVHLEIEPVSRNTCKGNIYRATVARVEPSLQSAFVDFGNEKQGFMPVGEIHPKIRGDKDRRAPIQEILRARQEILVQVVRDEIGQKGATLSTFISLPGRYLVLIPESEKSTGVSRKLSEEARERVKELTETMKVPDGFSLIVRTAGETASKIELAKDLLYLSRQWEHITKKFEESKGPTLLYAERSLPVRFVRDYFTKDIEEVVIDDDETLHEVSEFLQVLMPRGLSAVVRYAGDVPLFARYGVEGKVEDVFARQVFLPSGGSIVIDQTEAMVSIDVNSGRVKEKDIEETARATNVEAAQEIARQMILRDMGGLIVIDFIDMREKKYVREVEQALKDAFKNDKARTKLGHISEFGLLEMSRQRIKSSVNKGAFDSCGHCSGTGRLRSMDSVGMSVLRRIYELVAQKRVRYVIAMVPPQAARYLLNARRAELAMIERQYHLTIEVVPVEGMTATQVVLEHLEAAPAETGVEKVDRLKMQRVTQELDLVRNQLIKREEARIQIEASAARRGARVDYAEIYREVREMSPPEEGRGAEPEARPARHRHAAEKPAVEPVAAPAPAPVAVQPQPEPWEELPRPSGFGAWLRGLFGLAEPRRPEPEVAVPAPGAVQPAAPVAALPPAAEATPGEGRKPREDRRDDRRREGRGERRPDERGREPREGQQAREGGRDERRRERDERRREGRPPHGERGERQAADKVPEDKVREERVREERVREEKLREPLAAAAAVGAPVPATETEETAEAARRRRRRRRRGGRSEPSGVLNAAGGPLEEAVGGEDEEDLGATVAAAPGNESEAISDEREEHDERDEEQGEPQRRRRRRGGRQGERPAAPAAVAAAGDASGEATAEPAAAEVAVEPAAATEAEASDAGTPEGEAVTAGAEEAAVAVEEEAAAVQAVDARSLVTAEIERLRSEQAPAAAESAEPEDQAGPAAAAADQRPRSTGRFVVDLRTPSR